MVSEGVWERGSVFYSKNTRTHTYSRGISNVLSSFLPIVCSEAETSLSITSTNLWNIFNSHRRSHS